MYIYDLVTSIFCNTFKWLKFRLKSSCVTMEVCTKLLGLLACAWARPGARVWWRCSSPSFKLVVRFFSSLIYLIFLGGTWGCEDLTCIQNPCPKSHSHMVTSKKMDTHDHQSDLFVLSLEESVAFLPLTFWAAPDVDGAWSALNPVSAQLDLGLSTKPCVSHSYFHAQSCKPLRLKVCYGAF